MKKLDRNSRRMIVGILTGVCLLTAGAAGTAGYLTGKETVTNVFSVGNLKIDLKEPEWEPQDGDGENMCPGYSVYKNPTVKNTARIEEGGNPCYARMRVQIVNKDGKPITEKETLELIETTIRYDSTFMGTFSTKGEGAVIKQGRVPGYSLEEIAKLPMVNPLFKKDEERSKGNVLVFNYEGKEKDGILDIGEEATLFSAIVLPTQWTKREMDLIGDFKLVIQAEAIQITGFTTRENAYRALDAELTKGGSNG